MRSLRASLSACALAALCACASSEADGLQLAPVTDTVEVVIPGGMFVTTGGRRIPRERFVVELRLRVRAMQPEAAAGVRVVLAVPDDADDSAAKDADWILDQLQIMGISQVSYR
jgi:hypothetical protein